MDVSLCARPGGGSPMAISSSRRYCLMTMPPDSCYAVAPPSTGSATPVT